MTDRDVNYMKETWGTTSLVTDYKPKKKVLQEVVNNDLMPNCESSEELYEPSKCIEVVIINN